MSDDASPAQFPEPKADYRWVGPVLECPVCNGVWFHALIAMDPDTQLIGAWLCDAMCIDCDVLVHLATPIDVITREAAMTDEFESD